MTADFHSMTPEQRERAEELFGDVVESGDVGLIEREADPVVREGARYLWEMHGRAAKEGFLNEPIGLISEIVEEAERPAFTPGQRLAGRFEVKSLVGSGGMGEVYLARDERLGEDVAVKTIRRALAGDVEIRERFLGEVQAARRVTHPHVCRIYDVFDEGEAVFYSMEYLKGGTLEEFLREPGDRGVRKAVALQLAEGLHAAHENGIIHRDFKPQNVILREGEGGSASAVITDFGLARPFLGAEGGDRHSLGAGTLKYLAPEILRGERASVRSDIYAFGKVLEELLPGHSAASRCAAEDPEKRPGSLRGVIEKLRGGGVSRRWILGGLAVSAGSAAVEALRRPLGALRLGSRQRVLLNAFEAAAEVANRAGTLRDLFLTGIRQSPLVAIVPDERLRAVLRELRLPATLPAERRHLYTAAEIEKASLVVEGAVERQAGGLSLGVRVFRAGATSPAWERTHRVSDEREVVGLAETAVRDLRESFGESRLSLQSSVRLDRVTSGSPEAVDFYFRAVREYEKSDADAALALLERAIAIDGEFALAHMYRALALGASFRTGQGFEAADKAYRLRDRVTERERNWIEWIYFNLAGDYVSCLGAIRKNAVLYPDEAAFQRQTAGAYCRINRFPDAIAYNKRSVDLDPFSGNNWDEYICNLAEGNRAEEALQVYEKVRGQDAGTMVVEYGAGLAYMVKGDYTRSRKAFERLGGDANHDRWARLLCAGPAILEGKFAETAAALEGDLAYDIQAGEQLRRYQRHDLLGNLRLLMGDRGGAGEQAKALCAAAATGPYLMALRQGALLGVEAGEWAVAEEGLGKLREVERRWPSTHSQGARMHVEGVMREARGEEGGELLRKAKGLWPDPLVLFSVAKWAGKRKESGEQEGALAGLEALRGKIVKYYFPGLMVLGWVEQARFAVKISRIGEGRRYYQRVLEHWGVSGRDFGIVKAIREEARQVEKG